MKQLLVFSCIVKFHDPDIDLENGRKALCVCVWACGRVWQCTGVYDFTFVSFFFLEGRRSGGVLKGELHYVNWNFFS